MNKSLALKNKLYLFFLLIIFLFLFLYILYFLINGDRGIISYFKIKNLNSEYKISLAELNKKNNYFKNKVHRLNPNTLDLDFLDEKIREKTGYTEKNELIVKFDD